MDILFLLIMVSLSWYYIIKNCLCCIIVFLHNVTILLINVLYYIPNYNKYILIYCNNKYIFSIRYLFSTLNCIGLFVCLLPDVFSKYKIMVKQEKTSMYWRCYFIVGYFLKWDFEELHVCFATCGLCVFTQHRNLGQLVS